MNYVYERSAHAPPYSGEAATLADDIADTMTATGTHEFPLAPELGAEEFGVIQKVGLFARLGELAPEIFAAGATLGVGIAIGTGLRKMFISFTAPDDATEGGESTWSWSSVSWKPHGTEIFFGATVQQSPGAYLYDSHDGAGVIRWWEPPCTFSGLRPAAGARMENAVPSSAQCNVFVREVGFVLFPVYVDYPYLLETDIRPVAPLRPFTEGDEPLYTRSPAADPGTEAVESELDALDADGDELLRDELDWALTPGAQEKEEPASNGTKVTEDDRACKAFFGESEGGTDPGRRSPEAEPEAPDWDYDVDEFEGVYNPLTRSTQTVKLRWGTLSWGYRHIKDEHGWDLAARTRTEYALQTDTTPTVEKGPESFLYLGNLEGGPRGIRCRQRVIVSYRQDGVVPVGRGIISSYLEAY